MKPLLALATLLVTACSAPSPSSPSSSSPAHAPSPAPSPAPAPPLASASASSTPEETEFTDCGCGCCDVDPMDKCVDTAKGETIASIKKAALERQATMDCKLVGCARGFRYRVCPPGAPPAKP